MWRCLTEFDPPLLAHSKKKEKLCVTKNYLSLFFIIICCATCRNLWPYLSFSPLDNGGASAGTSAHINKLVGVCVRKWVVFSSLASSRSWQNWVCVSGGVAHLSLFPPRLLLTSPFFSVAGERWRNGFFVCQLPGCLTTHKIVQDLFNYTVDCNQMKLKLLQEILFFCFSRKKFII